MRHRKRERARERERENKRGQFDGLVPNQIKMQIQT